MKYADRDKAFFDFFEDYLNTFVPALSQPALQFNPRCIAMQNDVGVPERRRRVVP